MSSPSDTPTAYLQDRPALSRRQARILWIAASVFVAAVGAWVSDTPVIRRLENLTLDWRFRVRGPRPPRQDIVICEIDEESRVALKPAGGRLDLRHHVAEAVNHLADAGAAVIALDIVFEDPGDPASDARLAEVIAESNVVLAFMQAGGRLKRTHPMFREARPAEGSILVNTDPDGMLRRLPEHLGVGVVQDDGTIVILPHFPLLAAWFSLAVHRPDTPQLAFDGDVAVIGDRRAGPGELVDYAAMRGQGWRTLTFEQAATNRFDADDVAGAVVLIGESRMIADSFALPMADDLQPGVYYHANVVAQILDGRRFRARWTERWPRRALAAALGLAAALYFWWQRPWHRSAHGARWLALYVLIGIVVFPGGWTGMSSAAFNRGMVLPVAGPLAAMGLAAGSGLAAQWLLLSVNARRLTERMRRIEALFGRSVSQPVLDALKADPDAVARTQTRDVSVLFCDLRGFTAAAADQPPEAVARMLNEYYAHVTEPVFEHDGLIDKFVGDEVMVVFSVPFEQPDHAVRAVRTAVGIKRRLAEYNRLRTARGEPAVDCGIGIHSGPAAAGHVGSSRRANYTVVGRTVNLAARIEELTTGGEILISQATRDALPPEYSVHPWRTVEIRGLTGRFELFRVDPEDQAWDAPLSGRPVAAQAPSAQSRRDAI